jgi:hypothetical protein
MSDEVTPIPLVNEGFEQRWQAWQARGDEHDRATRRKLFLLAAAAALLLSGAVLSGLRW